MQLSPGAAVRYRRNGCRSSEDQVSVREQRPTVQNDERGSERQRGSERLPSMRVRTTMRVRMTAGYRMTTHIRTTTGTRFRTRRRSVVNFVEPLSYSCRDRSTSASHQRRRRNILHRSLLLLLSLLPPSDNCFSFSLCSFPFCSYCLFVTMP